MLTLTFKSQESYNELTNEFVETPSETVQFEHSLVSVSKWESKHGKPFLTADAKTPEEVLSYFQCMVVDDSSPVELIGRIENSHLTELNNYINSKHTATWFNDQNDPPRPNRETITAEVIYYWMVHFGIDFQCQYWHLNRLLTLIRVCGVKQEKPKKLGRAAAAEQQRSLNEQRRAQLGTSG